MSILKLIASIVREIVRKQSAEIKCDRRDGEDAFDPVRSAAAVWP